MQTKYRGLSLLEILIALFIFSIVSLILSKALQTVIMSQAVTKKSAQQLSELQMALLLFSRDLEQALDRPTTNALGNEENAFSGTATSLNFTHLPEGALHTSYLERSCYRIEDGKFIRDSWSVLGGKQGALHGRPLIKEVQQLEFRYLDNKKRYHSSWPPPDINFRLPRAVEINVVLSPGEKTQQTYLLPQQEVPHVSS